MSKYNYQTRSQVLLDILLEEVLDDINLCEQRMQAHLKHNDKECYGIELDYKMSLKEKEKWLRNLIKAESNSTAGTPTIIKTSFQGSEGYAEEYVSKTLV